ncbi:MAG: 50S ribosomal protein L15 [Hyphomicrobiaceae bacterium]
MRLNKISDNPGARQSRKRLGRGIGSGLGKTGGRGGKGQTARTGVRINGFEGGQMPLFRRLPKRGFKRPFPEDYNEINIGSIQSAVEAGRIAAGSTVSEASLVAAGILRRAKDGLRLLGSGEITTKLAFEVVHATAAARAAVEKAGGSISILEAKVDEDAEKKRKKTAAKGKGPSSRKKKAVDAD